MNTGPLVKEERIFFEITVYGCTQKIHSNKIFSGTYYFFGVVDFRVFRTNVVDCSFPDICYDSDVSIPENFFCDSI